MQFDVKTSTDSGNDVASLGWTLGNGTTATDRYADARRFAGSHAVTHAATDDADTSPPAR